MKRVQSELIKPPKHNSYNTSQSKFNSEDKENKNYGFKRESLSRGNSQTKISNQNQSNMLPKSKNTTSQKSMDKIDDILGKCEKLSEDADEIDQVSLMCQDLSVDDVMRNFSSNAIVLPTKEEKRQRLFDSKKDIINQQIKKNTKRWEKEEKMKQYSKPIVDNQTYLTGLGFEIQQDEEEEQEKAPRQDRFKETNSSQLVKKEDKVVSFKVRDKPMSTELVLETTEDSMDAMLRDIWAEEAKNKRQTDDLAELRKRMAICRDGIDKHGDQLIRLRNSISDVYTKNNLKGGNSRSTAALRSLEDFTKHSLNQKESPAKAKAIGQMCRKPLQKPNIAALGSYTSNTSKSLMTKSSSISAFSSKQIKY